MDTQVLTNLFTVSAHITKDFVLGKPDIKKVIGLVLADGSEFNSVIKGLHGIPNDLISIDSDLGQELSATFRRELGEELAQHTVIDDVVGRLLVLLPEIKSALAAYKAGTLDQKLDATYAILKHAVGIVELFQK